MGLKFFGRFRRVRDLVSCRIPDGTGAGLSFMKYWLLSALMLSAAGYNSAAHSAAAEQNAAVEHTQDGVRFETGPEPDFVIRRELPAQWDPQAPGADDRRWRQWRYEVQADRRRGRDIVHYELAYQPRTPSLISEAGKIQVDFNPGFQTLRIHRVELMRDGIWQNRLVPEKISLARREEDFEQDQTNGGVTALIVLEDVRIDDIVRVAYSISGSNPILAGQTSDRTILGWRNPMLESGLRVLYDPGAEFSVHRENTEAKPTVRRSADALEVSVRAERSPTVLDEERYPAWYQPYPMVSIAQKRRWSDVVAWALPLYPKQSQPFDADLEGKLAQWRTLPNDHARFTAALRTVQNDVRYFGVEIGENTHRPNPPAQVWRNRYGDCKDKVWLLVTLLERMGIEAVPALVSVGRGRAIADFVPSASVFDHVIVRVKIGGETIWADPTISQQGGDPRKVDLAEYGMALPIVAGVDALQAIPAPQQANAGVEVFERFVADADGQSVMFEVETIYTGSDADYHRRNTLGQRDEDLSRRYAEFYRKRYGELEVLSAPTLHNDIDRNELRVLERYRLKSPFQSQSGGVRMLEAYADALDSPSALPESISRNGPLDYGTRGRYRHEISVTLPERWKPTFSTENNTITSPAFRFERKVQLAEREVKLVYDMNVDMDEVPAAQVAAHLQKLRNVRDEISANMRFTMPTAQNDAQRQERLRALLNGVIDGEKKP